MQDLCQSGYEILKNAIKSSNSFPSGENFDYYSCFPSFNNARIEQMKKILDLMQSIISKGGIIENIKKRNLEEKFDLLIDANDFFLDRANACMDEESGIKRNTPAKSLVVSEISVQGNVNGSWNKSTRISASIPKGSDNSQTVRLLAGKLIERPQSYFKDKVDNSHNPWEPRIKYKHNLLKPLDIHLIESDIGPVFNHPYEFELNKFQVPDTQLKKKSAVKYKKLEETPLVMVEKPEDLKILLEGLRKHTEIAVDLEHHSYRSFQGITCLMQISTRDTDYIIDTLSLRSELHELNEIFTNPKILKVFHGADSDIQWLQKDLSIYVANMFDTHQAAIQLGLQYLNLAYLLRSLCNIELNKHFQLADWRIRPLPEELIKYAREDTHYLLYIKDKLQNQLIDSANGQTNILKVVYDRSTDICRLTYKKPVWSEDSYLNMYQRSQKLFNNRQMYALKELHRWRDQIARDEDDSISYVLPNHMLLHIAEVLPKEMQGILALCNPIPPLVRSNLLAIHNIIRKAIQQPLVKPILAEDIPVRMPKTTQVCKSEIWNQVPHDLSREMEVRADLPCLLDTQTLMNNNEENDVEHCITVFDSPVSEDESLISLAKLKTIFVSPFERYRRVIPMVAEYEAKEAEKKMKEEEERIQKLKDEKREINDSINRVYEHFVKVAKETKEESAISQAHILQNHKRKLRKESDNDDDEPTTKIIRTSGPSKIKNTQDYSESEDVDSEQDIDNDIPEVVNIKEGEKTAKFRTTMKKGEKRKFKNELRKKGFMPVEKFNYKNVDFSSFQGGSKNSSNKTMFQEQKMKDKVNKNKKKRRKPKGLNI